CVIDTGPSSTRLEVRDRHPCYALFPAKERPAPAKDGLVPGTGARSLFTSRLGTCGGRRFRHKGMVVARTTRITRSYSLFCYWYWTGGHTVSEASVAQKSDERAATSRRARRHRRTRNATAVRGADIDKWRS